MLAALFVAGCAEKAPEKGPADVEKARQDHIKIMMRETGQKPPSQTP